MTQTDPNIIHANTPAAEAEAYDSLFDRFFIRVGDFTTRYFGVIVGLIILGLIGLAMIIGSVLVIRSVGQRMNDIQVREQEHQAFIEQQIQQTSNQTDRLATKRQKTVDESGWFIVLEEGEELPSADTDDEAEIEVTIDADASQQFVRPSLQNRNLLISDDLSDIRPIETEPLNEAASN